jgi:hypothetical protein
MNDRLRYVGRDGRLGYEDGPDVLVTEFIVTETSDGAFVEATLDDPDVFHEGDFQ